MFECTGSLARIYINLCDWQVQKNKKPTNNDLRLWVNFVSLKSGLSRQEIEPNAGIIEEDLYFKAFIEQKLDIRIERRKFKNSK